MSLWRGKLTNLGIDKSYKEGKIIKGYSYVQNKALDSSVITFLLLKFSLRVHSFDFYILINIKFFHIFTKEDLISSFIRLNKKNIISEKM